MSTLEVSMGDTTTECSICGTRFVPKFSFQTAANAAYCSQTCHERGLFGNNEKHCTTCNTAFEPKFAYQMASIDGEQRYFCSMECRQAPVQNAIRKTRGAKRIAVMNQKGGTGKTTTTVSLAHGLAERGYKTLVVDMDSQGNVGVCLGETGSKTLYDVMINNVAPSSAAKQVRDNLDLLASNDLLAKVEVHLAHVEDPAHVLKNRFRDVTDYDYIILDCGPSLSLLNQNALYFSDEVLIPVACDYLSLVGVKQIIKTLKNVQQQLRHPITIFGVLPTFYDVRNNISHEVVKTLERYFKDKVLEPIRINTKLKEAPSKQMSVFEYAPKSGAADDYRALVDRVIRSEHAAIAPSAVQFSL